MKLLSGVVLLHASEQAFAHANLVQFPNHENAANILVPVSVVLLLFGSMFVVWGLLTECGAKKTTPPQ